MTIEEKAMRLSAVAPLALLGPAGPIPSMLAAHSTGCHVPPTLRWEPHFGHGVDQLHLLRGQVDVRGVPALAFGDLGVEPRALEGVGGRPTLRRTSTIAVRRNSHD
jgi:hypothetical protein